MTYSEAIEQLRWYFEYDDGIAADNTTKAAYQIAIKVLERHSEKPPHLMPCICGRKKLQLWWNYVDGGWTYECPDCGRKSKLVKKRKDLNKAWNDMIEKETGDYE